MRTSTALAPLLALCLILSTGWLLLDANRKSAELSLKVLRLQVRASVLTQRLRQANESDATPARDAPPPPPAAPSERPLQPPPHGAGQADFWIGGLR